MRTHQILGLSEREYEDRLTLNRLAGGDGVPVSVEPRWHSHPVLGIRGHAHGPTVEAARTSHTHRPEVTWDFKPIPIQRDYRGHLDKS